jgi:hypothetical protein
MAKTGNRRRNAGKDEAVERIRELVFAMEEPLDAAADLARALDLMGFGLNAIHDDDAGQPVLAIAETLSERLSEAKRTWRAILKASSARV